MGTEEELPDDESLGTGSLVDKVLNIPCISLDLTNRCSAGDALAATPPKSSRMNKSASK
jgi:hypothetical protein